MPTEQELAQEAYDWFERRQRDGGEWFVCLKDGAPEWVSDLVYHAHGGDFLPDDWRYDAIRSALGWVADNDGDEDEAGEFADSHVDVYTGRRLEWLSSNLSRVAYVDEAVEDFGQADGVVEAIGLGQYRESEEVYSLVWEKLTERLDEVEDEDDEG